MESSFRPERRGRARTQVHWPVLLLPHCGSGAIETVTQNLSSNGFYSYSPEPLQAGQTLLCTLKVPSHDPKGEERALALECTVTVLRAEAVSKNLFGIAFQIVDYHLIRGGSRRA